MGQITKEEFLKEKKKYKDKKGFSYLKGRIHGVEETEDPIGYRIGLKRPKIKKDIFIDLSELNIPSNLYLIENSEIEVIVKNLKSEYPAPVPAVLYHNFNITEGQNPYFTKNSIL